MKEAQRVAEEANEKLKEALMAQKRAEEDSEIEKFRAVELEQAGIEAVNKKEEEWQKELESVRNQHALDVAALLSANQELQQIKQELTMVTDAKNQALSHADDATKIAEIQAEKAEILSAELARVKSLLDSKLETEAGENNIVLELKTEIESLKQELEELYQKHQELQEENVHAFETFEQKIMKFRELVKKEEDNKISKLSVEEGALEKLKQEVANLRKDLELKEYKIEELSRIKSSLKEDVIRYQQALELSKQLAEVKILQRCFQLRVVLIQKPELLFQVHLLSL